MSALGHTGQRFAEIRATGRGALVGFLHVGYPDVPTSLAALRALTGEDDSPGVDLVEVGLPYSDPMIDGVTVQRAGTRALERGVRTRDVFAAVEAVAATGTPAVVMTYWNLVEQYGPDRFARDLAAAGGSGSITPDLTPDEAGEWLAVSDAHGLDRIFLVSPSSTDARLAATVAACRGWVYATSVMGVTGARATTSSAAPEPGRPDPGRRPARRGGRRSGSLQRDTGPGGHRLRRRGDRGLGAGPHVAGCRGRRSSGRLHRAARPGRGPG